LRISWIPPPQHLHAGARIFGRVPLFYFLVHFYMLRALTFAFAQVWPDDGYPLGVVYLVWVSVVAVLYPVCLWSGGLTERRRDWGLSYL
jgi:hypothetical protein